MKTARCMLEYMKNEGVEYFFGIPGSGIAPLFDAFYDFGGIKVMLVKHEQGASFMADGYYRVSHRVASCGGTVGPGAVNIISGLDVPYTDSIPVLAITSNVLTRNFGRGDIQEATGWGRSLSHVDCARSVTKWATLLFNPHLVPEAIRRAFRIMLSGRKGPVLLDVCFDVFREEIESEIIPPERYRPLGRIRGDPILMEKAADTLLKADAPAILAGGGIHDGAYAELLELAELLSIPVATTLMGKSGFPEDHQLALGVAGKEGHAPANKLLTNNTTDVLLAIGCMFHTATTKGWRPGFGGRTLIQVDIDPTEIGKNYQVEVGIVGDSKLVLQDLLNLIRNKISRMSPDLQRTINRRKEDRVKRLLQLKDELRYYKEPEMFSDTIPMKPQRALREIRDFAPDDAIFWCDSGNNLAWAERYIKARLPRTFLVDGGLTHMGFSLPAAMGAKLAAPDKLVIDIIGNASFEMLSHEVITAAAYNIQAIWCILNDHILGRIKHGQKFGYANAWEPERYIASSAYSIDFEKFAEACGVFGRKVERPGEIKDTLKEAVESGKPAIIDIEIDPDEIPPNYSESNAPAILKYPYLESKKMPVPNWPQPYEQPL